ncbi:hypothetical protein BDZ91DRAFT_753031 [Kalaharituber pfeilii]|nr:hypothetical protein BDZ91DRAFT_753031 [Kalaharituber pfeilii]
MENTGNDRKYMDGHGNDWKQLPAGSTAFRRVLRLSGGFWGSGFFFFFFFYFT